MKLTRVSKWTGKESTMDIDVTEQQLFMWSNGALIQDAMPHLTVDEREFIMTGYTPEDWAAMEAFWDDEDDSLEILHEWGMDDDD